MALMRCVYMTKGEIMSSERLNTTEATQAERKPGMKNVLIVSTLLAIVVMAIAAGIFGVMP